MKGKKTLIGLLGVFVPWIDQLYQAANALPEGVMPEKARIVVSGLGLILAFYGRLVAKGPLVTK